ncbi:MAG: DUF4065 domain-containing protein [Lachnospiraceae bacterium]|nr:DUF4065 domain-containing protein [Lachnospiraceae bacterium]
MGKERCGFCAECRELTQYEFKKVVRKCIIKEKAYDMEITVAFCKNCGEEMNVPGIMDLRSKEVDEQYRAYEDIISVNDIQKLMDIYNIGKAPLSLALGFGEITITRYLQGQVPSKEYSVVMKKALESPKYMLELLKNNMDKIGDTAYKKASKAAEELNSLMSVSEKMLSVISYIFERAHEVTPLALQKILYFIQGIYMVLFGTPIYDEDCVAWMHGPVYESVYEMFKTFKYNPIDDNRFVMFKNRFQELSKEEKEVIDLIIDSFGMYSGKALEKITHNEDPWKQAREGYLPMEPSNVVIEKQEIKRYFDKVSEEYDVKHVDGLKKYINNQLEIA